MNYSQFRANIHSLLEHVNYNNNKTIRKPPNAANKFRHACVSQVSHDKLHILLTLMKKPLQIISRYKGQNKEDLIDSKIHLQKEKRVWLASSTGI